MGTAPPSRSISMAHSGPIIASGPFRVRCGEGAPYVRNRRAAERSYAAICGSMEDERRIVDRPSSDGELFHRRHQSPMLPFVPTVVLLQASFVSYPGCRKQSCALIYTSW